MLLVGWIWPLKSASIWASVVLGSLTCTSQRDSLVILSWAHVGHLSRVFATVSQTASLCYPLDQTSSHKLLVGS